MIKIDENRHTGSFNKVHKANIKLTKLTLITKMSEIDYCNIVGRLPKRLNGCHTKL